MMPSKINFNYEQLQKDMIELKTSDKVAQKYGCHKETILRRARKKGLVWPSDNAANHNFFSEWSRPMAYILGFITGDGFIQKDRPYVCLDLNPKDTSVLNYCRRYLNPECSIYTYERHNKKRNRYYTSSKIMIFSHKMVKDLAMYNITPQKTGQHELNFDIPKDFLGDYVRGFFDADGSVYYRYNKINSKMTCQSQQFLSELANRIGIKYSVEFTKKKLMSVKYFYKTSLQLRDIMYQDEEFALQRKKERFFNPAL